MAANDQKTPAEILKKIRALEIKTRGLVQTVFAGDYHSVFKGRGMNFDDVREYQPGDEIRAIDWNVTARLGTAFVKKFTEERELTVMLVVDVSASGNFGSVITIQARTRRRSRVSARLQRHPQQRQGRFASLHRSRRAFHSAEERPLAHAALIREILFFEPQAAAPSRRSRSNYLNKVVTRRAVVFFVSDFQTGDFSRELAVSGRRHDFIAIHIQDERERSSAQRRHHHPGRRGDRRANRDQHRRSLDARAFQPSWRKRSRPNCNGRCVATTSTPSLLQTGEDYLPALRSFFKQRERRLAVRLDRWLMSSRPGISRHRAAGRLLADSDLGDSRRRVARTRDLPA